MSDRIGIRSASGTRWPKTDMNGNTYDRAAGVTTAELGGGQFVVLPIGYVDHGDLAALRDTPAPDSRRKDKKEATRDASAD